MNMKKTLPAIIAAFAITLCIGAAILFVGGNALLNGNGITLSNSKDAVAAQVSYADQAAQIKDLQAQVAEYKTREAQYQTQLNDAAQQIRNANASLQQFQSLLTALQRRGIITISSDGRIFLNQ
jgi:uncharacterized surface protein with fasciclin (FAS1) repeats